MSLLNLSGQNQSPLKQLVNELRTVIRENGSEFANSTHTRFITSMESLSPTDADSLNMAAQAISETLRHSFEAISDSNQSLGFESLTPAQVEAGVVAALAAGDPVEYARTAMTTRAASSKNIPVIDAETAGVAGRLDYRDTHSMEAFDQRELSEMIPYSIAFNVQAARQDDFSETFYPTVVVSPENGGLDISIDRITVFNAIQHQVSGKTTDFSQRNLVEAVSDASILADESTALIPFIQTGQNENLFVDSANVAPYFRKVANVDVETAPLKIGEKINLLGVSQHPQLIGAGVMDNTDSIDSRMYLDRVYMKFGDALGSVMRFSVSRLPRNAFLKSVEGADRELALNFRSEALTLNAASTAADGSIPTETQAIRDGDYTVRLSVSMTGHAHVEFGTVQVYNSPVTVSEILDADGNEISLDAGDGAAIVTALAPLTVIGYELGAARTNSNRRTRGLLINQNTETERFAIQLGSPISAPSPVGSNRDASDLDSLVAAARIRNSNNAVTTLLNYADSLRAVVTNRRLGYGNPSIEGVARHSVVPFYEEVNLDISATINSITSKDRAEDISAVLVNAIRDVAYRMYRNSGYQAALDSSSYGGRKPVLLVGTDPVIQRHLMVSGDNRTFGNAFEDSKVVTSFDSRMDGKIIITFSRQGTENTADPLSFGIHGWIPELTSSIMVARDGATYQEAMVQPRSRHINNLPVMAVVNVSGLEDVLTSKIAVDMYTTNP